MFCSRGADFDRKFLAHRSSVLARPGSSDGDVSGGVADDDVDRGHLLCFYNCVSGRGRRFGHDSRFGALP